MMNAWQVFTGDCEKEFYDVQLHDGRTLSSCWPNNGEFFSMISKDTASFAEVFAIRLLKDYEFQP